MPVFWVTYSDSPDKPRRSERRWTWPWRRRPRQRQLTANTTQRNAKRRLWPLLLLLLIPAGIITFLLWEDTYEEPGTSPKQIAAFQSQEAEPGSNMPGVNLTEATLLTGLPEPGELPARPSADIPTANTDQPSKLLDLTKSVATRTATF